MKLAGATLTLLALAFPAVGQWTDVRVPEHVYTAVPFAIEIDLGCPPPGEAAPPIGCNGTMGVWFEASDNSAIVPKGFVTLYPYQASSAGPFTFHKPGRAVLNVLAVSRETRETILVGQVEFLVKAPSGGAARRR